MRSIGNFHSEWGRGQALLVSLVATAVGAVASATVILSLVGSPTTQPGVLSISPRAIVRDLGASDVNKTVQDQLTSEIPLRPAGTNEVSTQTEAEHQPDVHKLESPKHSRVISRTREPYWRGRFTRAYSQLPRFSSW